MGPPIAVEAPEFIGQLFAGEQLIAFPGRWTNYPTSFRYQWFSCDPAGMSCPDIPGATQERYVLRDADVGRFIGIEVVTTNAAGDSRAGAIGCVRPGLPGHPQERRRASISGTARAGSTLTANRGTWTANPTAFSTWWYRCDVKLEYCSFTGATTSTYALGSADVGKVLLVGVVATNAGVDSDEVFSAEVGPDRGRRGGAGAAPACAVIAIAAAGEQRVHDRQPASALGRQPRVQAARTAQGDVHGRRDGGCRRAAGPVPAALRRDPALGVRAQVGVDRRRRAP